MCNKREQKGRKGEMPLLCFFINLPCLPFRSHSSLRAVWIHYEAFSCTFEEITASLTKCQASHVLPLSHSLRACIESWTLKLRPWKSFILDNFFLGSLFGCHGSFPINRFPFGSPWLPLYSSSLPQHVLAHADTLHTHKHTHKHA